MMICNQASEPQFVLLPGNNGVESSSGEIRSQVHCIEPLPPTIRGKFLDLICVFVGLSVLCAYDMTYNMCM